MCVQPTTYVHNNLGVGEGGIGRLLVEGDHGSMIVVPVSDEASIAVLLEKEARIGAALYAVKGAAQEIRVILEGNASWTLQPDPDPGVSAAGCRW